MDVTIMAGFSRSKKNVGSLSVRAFFKRRRLYLQGSYAMLLDVVLLRTNCCYPTCYI